MMSNTGFGRDVEDFLRNIGAVGKDEPVKEHGIRINAILAAGSEKKTVRILVSNPSGSEEIEFLLLNAHVEELSLSVGEIEEEIISSLEYYAEVARAYSSAFSSFAFAPSSYSALYKKLLQKGFPNDVCSDAIGCLRRTGVIREDEIALRRAQIFVDKRWGRLRILAKLREEGFDDGSLALALDFLDETDFASSCADLIRKRFGEVPEEKRDRDLMYASLGRMGYSSVDIREAIKLLR